jgi:membrane protease YdiL (CAAX protease family)
MNSEAQEHPSATDRIDVEKDDLGRQRWSSALAAAVCVAYVLLLLVMPPPSVGASLPAFCRLPRKWVNQLISSGYELLGIEEVTRELRYGAFFFLTMLLLPWLVMALLRRGRFHDLGWRLPNRLTWRFLALSFVVSLPFVIWMALSPQFEPYYRPYLQAGATTFLTYYVAVLFCEHFFFHGFLLAILRRGHRWPAPPPEDRSAPHGLHRALQWLGLAQPTDGARSVKMVTRWIGLPDGCVTAVVVSGLLFGAIHFGKDPRELALSFPGGLLVAFVAYRCNSFFAPLILHGLTAGAAVLVILLL